jgi:RHS repeat-associated protein
MGLGETESLERATKTTTSLDEVLVHHVVAPEGERVGATPEMVEYVTYTAYGQTESDYRNQRWQNFREQYRFTGNEDDIEVGLSYHGARYYSPALKRFMSADPVTVHSAGSDINPYSYGDGNPTMNVDPDGRCAWIGAVIGAVISVGIYIYATAKSDNFDLSDGSWWAGLGVAAGSGALAGLGGWAAGFGMSAALGGSASASLGGALAIGAAAGAGATLAGYSSAYALTVSANKVPGVQLSTNGYSWTGLGNAMLIGTASGGVAGSVGSALGSGSSNFWYDLAGSSLGAGAGATTGYYLATKIIDDKNTASYKETVGLAVISAMVGISVVGQQERERRAVIEDIQQKMQSAPDTVAGKNSVIRYAEERLRSEGVDSGAAKYASDLNERPKLEDAYAITHTTTGGIEVGPKAFGSGMTLADTLVHENLHRDQSFAMGLREWNPKEEAVNEIAAYRRGREFVQRCGGDSELEKNDIAGVETYEAKLRQINVAEDRLR